MNSIPTFQLIDNQRELESFCQSIAAEKLICFDTEFVSEDRYHSELCLLQVAAGEKLGIIDPFRLTTTDPFWNLLAEGDHITVAHAGREEFLFCKRFAGSRPAHLFDVQIAAGLIGLEYPAAYATLVSKLIGKTLNKGETRSDWRRRPLSKAQISYAVQDVVHLEKLYQKISTRLAKLKRTLWMSEEMEYWQTELERATTQEVWRRVSGVSTLDKRALGIARELWNWREKTARERDLPARRILRDDLLVELAKRGTSAVGKMKSIRGMERRQYARYYDQISRAIQTGLELPDRDLPKKKFSTRVPSLGMLGQFLTTAMNVVCQQNKIAPGVFSTTSELRMLAAWHLGMTSEPENRLTSGWRRELLEPVLKGILEGRIGIRVDKPQKDAPLVLFEIDGS